MLWLGFCMLLILSGLRTFQRPPQTENTWEFFVGPTVTGGLFTRCFWFPILNYAKSLLYFNKKEEKMIFSTLSGKLAGKHEESGALVREDGTVLRRIGSSNNHRWSRGRAGNRQGHLSIFSRKVMKNFYVHRLVAEVFIPNPEGKPIVDHIDRDPKNNSVTNLRWVTNRRSQAHAL